MQPADVRRLAAVVKAVVVIDEAGDGWVSHPALYRRQVHRVPQGGGAVSVEADRKVESVHCQGEWITREDWKGGE